VKHNFSFCCLDKKNTDQGQCVWTAVIPHRNNWSTSNNTINVGIKLQLIFWKIWKSLSTVWPAIMSQSNQEDWIERDTQTEGNTRYCYNHYCKKFHIDFIDILLTKACYQHLCMRFLHLRTEHILRHGKEKQLELDHDFGFFIKGAKL